MLAIHIPHSRRLERRTGIFLRENEKVGVVRGTGMYWSEILLRGESLHR